MEKLFALLGIYYVGRTLVPAILRWGGVRRGH